MLTIAVIQEIESRWGCMWWGEGVTFKGKMYSSLQYTTGFPGDSVVKNPPANAGDAGSIPRSGRCPVEGGGNPHQYSCLENPIDRAAWQATVQGVTKSQTWLRDWAHTVQDPVVHMHNFYIFFCNCLLRWAQQIRDKDIQFCWEGNVKWVHNMRDAL